MKTAMLILKWILTLVGYGIIVYYINWQVAVALFLLEWAHNADQHYKPE